MVGGIAANRAGFDGYLDEFQLYNKGLTAEEVKKSMEHQTVIPESLIGYWDFETEPNENNEIIRENSQKKLYVLAAHQIALWEYDIPTGKCSFTDDYFRTLGLKEV